jgi:hypothetical protein
MRLRLIGRRLAGDADGIVDRPAAVQEVTYQVGRLLAAVVSGEVAGSITPVGTAWGPPKVSGPAGSPRLVRRLEVYNPTGGPLSFCMGITAAYSANPNLSTDHAFLAWETVVPARGAWRWSGAAALIGRHIYVKGSAAGLVLFREVEALDD